MTPEGESVIEKICGKVLGGDASKTVVDIATRIVMGHSITVPVESLNDPKFLPVANGIVDLEKLEITPYSPTPTPSRLFTKRVEIEVDVGVLDLIKSGKLTNDYWRTVAPNWMAFLERFYDKENRERLEDLFGSIFWPRPVKKKIGFIVGDPDTGKSTLVQVLEGVLGPLTAKLSLDALSSDRFSIIELYGVRVNISSERPRSKVDVEVMKRLSGGDPVTANRKHRSYFSFTPYATLIFLMNRLPMFREVDEAFLDRVYLVFTQNPLSREERDPSFAERLLAERKQILHWMLWCYWRLKQRGMRYRNDLPLEDKRESIEESSSPIFEFVKDECIEDPAWRVERRRLYEAYIEWCREKGYEGVARRTFFEVMRTRYRETKVRGERYFVGLTLREGVEAQARLIE